MSYNEIITDIREDSIQDICLIDIDSYPRKGKRIYYEND